MAFWKLGFYGQLCIYIFWMVVELRVFSALVEIRAWRGMCR